MQFFKISEIDGVFADAYLCDDERLVFLSVWGRDTALQEFIARLQLSKSENGIRDFHIEGENVRQYASISNIDDLEKTTIKTSADTVLGQLTQLWIYDRLAIKPDTVNHRALMLYKTHDARPNLWPLVKSVCALPLLDHWQDLFLATCFNKQWIRILENGYGVSGFYLKLGEDVEPVVSDMIHTRALTLY